MVRLRELRPGQPVSGVERVRIVAAGVGSSSKKLKVTPRNNRMDCGFIALPSVAYDWVADNVPLSGSQASAELQQGDDQEQQQVPRNTIDP